MPLRPRAGSGGAEEPGAHEAGTDEMGAEAAGIGEAGTDEMGAEAAGIGEVGTDEMGSEAAGAGEVGTGEVGTDEMGSEAAGAGESGTDAGASVPDVASVTMRHWKANDVKAQQADHRRSQSGSYGYPHAESGAPHSARGALPTRAGESARNDS